MKFYTEEGNYDMVGNNTPVFFIRDPLKFPDFIHTQKRNPATNLKDADMFWDFLSLTPGVHPPGDHPLLRPRYARSYRNMNGYTSHTYMWYNRKGEHFWVKLHFKTEQGDPELQRRGGEPHARHRSLTSPLATCTRRSSAANFPPGGWKCR